MQFLQEGNRCAIGAKVYPRIAQVIFEGIFIMERRCAIGCTTAFGVINCVQIGPKILYSGDVIPGAGCTYFGQLFSIGSIRKRDICIGRVNDVIGRVEVIVG